MSEPDASHDREPGAGGKPTPIARLKKRADFQRASRGRRWQCEAFALQAVSRSSPVADERARVGFTVTRKVGGAVERNRIRRRLKEALRLTNNLETRPDHDYVLLARREALARRFDFLRADLSRAFAAVHAKNARSFNDRDRSK